jgi:NAD-dependent dihydropyrimidine dehydrogenase PreA subunit
MLLTLPILLWSMVMFSRTLMRPGVAPKVAALLTLVFMVALFYQMMRTRSTNRWRRIFFVALGFLFPIGFIWDLVALRGSMSIPMERMLSGDTPFCFLAIPMMIVPAALTRTVIFPGSILPTASNPHAVASMVAMWLAATLVLGKGWCSYGCFFGGIEEGFASFRKKPAIRKLDPRWRWMPWAVLAAIVLLSAAVLEPVYCTWLCPFKAVTEYPEVRSVETAAQAGVFIALFLALVVVLPLLSKKRTQCSFFCPFGAFQSIFNKTSAIDVRIDRSRCQPCNLCEKSCPTLSIDADAVKAGQPMMSCMKCGACVDACPRGAAVWHIKGTEVGAAPERARLLQLYAAWGFAAMFGGGIIANTLTKLLGLVV